MHTHLNITSDDEGYSAQLSVTGTSIEGIGRHWKALKALERPRLEAYALACKFRVRQCATVCKTVVEQPLAMG
jgi:hypothetical protein